jgi:hypothetical protein
VESKYRLGLRGKNIGAGEKNIGNRYWRRKGGLWLSVQKYIADPFKTLMNKLRKRQAK